MRKLFITGVLLCSAIILIGAQTGFAWQNFNEGCLTCHPTTAGTGLHTGAGHTNCASCHPGGVPGQNVLSSACIVCHPAGNTGLCPLIDAPAHAGTKATCLGCHTTCAVTTTTTTVPEDCLTIDPTSVTVDGVNDETLDVVVTFTRPDVINIPPADLAKLVIEVNTTCAQYITLNGSPVINVNTTNVTATQNITVQGDAADSTCSIKVSDPQNVANPPLNCEASFTIISSPTTTTTVPTTTTTIPEEGCMVMSVEPAPAFLKLRPGLLPKLRRIIITGMDSNWNRSTAVSIEDIPIVIPLRVQPTKIYALMVIPSTLFGRFTPGEKEVGVVTGNEFCTGTVDIE